MTIQAGCLKATAYVVPAFPFHDSVQNLNTCGSCAHLQFRLCFPQNYILKNVVRGNSLRGVKTCLFSNLALKTSQLSNKTGTYEIKIGLLVHWSDKRSSYEDTKRFRRLYKCILFSCVDTRSVNLPTTTFTINTVSVALWQFVRTKVHVM